MKTRVLHIIPELEMGGAQRVVVDLLKFHDNSKFDVALCCLYGRQGTVLEKELDKSNIKVFYLNKHSGPDCRIFKSIAKVFYEFKPDVVHTHLYILKYALLPILLLRIPVAIHTIHSDPNYEVDFMGKMIHKLAFKSRKVIPVSISNELSKKTELLYGNCYSPVIINGVDIPKYQVEKSLVTKDTLGLGDQIIILHIGTFKPAKNHSLLLEAFFELNKHNTQCILLLAGDGILYPEIVNHVRRRGLDNKIIFLGLRHDIPQLISIADFVVLSSEWEGVPISILEAMAAGKPVVSTAVGGVPEIIENGVSGYLTPSNDKNALANAMLELANNADKRIIMGKAARKQVQKFDVKKTAHDYEELYIKYLKK